LTADFEALVSVPDPQIDLARAALTFAQDAYPELDPAVYLAQLDDWAAIIRPEVDAGSTHPPFQPVSDLLFERLGFSGNESDYYDPRNSYLNDVIERRTGLPIALSALYLEVGWRVGLNLNGVGLPGHFIVRCDQVDRTWFIDPFRRGRILDEADCARLTAEATGGSLPFSHSLLRPSSRREILTRMLNNLKAVYIQREALEQARPVIERLIELNPRSAENMRDLGLVHFRLGTYRLAVSLLETYFALDPNAEDIESIRQVVSAARGELARWN
jgi:regulator of sirC expression with transglutaminase-like and TPR domain